MKLPLRQISLLLVCALGVTGCASKSTRQARAYEKYVRKSSGARAKQRALLRPAKPQMPPPQQPSDPVESTETGPQAMTSEGSE